MKMMIRSYCSLVVLVFLSLSFVLSCATSSGDAWSRSTSGERAAHNRARAAGNSRPQPIDRPESTRDPTLSSNASYTTLVIRGLPAGAKLWLNDAPYGYGSTLYLRPGSHHVRVVAFGREDWEYAFSIVLFERRTVDYDAAPVAFAVTRIEVCPAVLPAAGISLLGSGFVRVVASAPGTVNLLLQAEDGTLMRSYPLRFQSAEQLVSLDGLDEFGNALAPGVYYARVEGEQAEARFSVSVDEGEPLRAASPFNPVSGALFAPDARTLGPGNADFAFAGFGHVALDGSGFRVPLALSTRFGLDIGLGAELTLGANWVPNGEIDLSTIGMSGSFKLRLWRASMSSRSDLALAGFVRGNLSSFLDEAAGGWPSSWDGLANYRGIGAGLAFEVRDGGFRCFASTELSLSDFFPGYGLSPLPVPHAFLWLYFKGGVEGTLEVDSLNALTLALSAAAHTAPLSQGFAMALPAQIGFQASWYNRRSHLVPSFILAAEADDRWNWYLSGGLGLNLLF